MGVTSNKMAGSGFAWIYIAILVLAQGDKLD